MGLTKYRYNKYHENLSSESHVASRAVTDRREEVTRLKSLFATAQARVMIHTRGNRSEEMSRKPGPAQYEATKPTLLRLAQIRVIMIDIRNCLETLCYDLT